MVVGFVWFVFFDIMVGCFWGYMVMLLFVYVVSVLCVFVFYCWFVFCVCGYVWIDFICFEIVYFVLLGINVVLFFLFVEFVYLELIVVQVFIVFVMMLVSYFGYSCFFFC